MVFRMGAQTIQLEPVKIGCLKQFNGIPLVILLIVAENDGIFKGNCPFAGKFVRLYNFQRPPAKNLVSILYTFCQEAV